MIQDLESESVDRNENVMPHVSQSKQLFSPPAVFFATYQTACTLKYLGQSIKCTYRKAIINPYEMLGLALFQWHKSG